MHMTLKHSRQQTVPMLPSAASTGWHCVRSMLILQGRRDVYKQHWQAEGKSKWREGMAAGKREGRDPHGNVLFPSPLPFPLSFTSFFSPFSPPFSFSFSFPFLPLSFFSLKKKKSTNPTTFLVISEPLRGPKTEYSRDLFSSRRSVSYRTASYCVVLAKVLTV